MVNGPLGNIQPAHALSPLPSCAGGSLPPGSSVSRLREVPQSGRRSLCLLHDLGGLVGAAPSFSEVLVNGIARLERG